MRRRPQPGCSAQVRRKPRSDPLESVVNLSWREWAELVMGAGGGAVVLQYRPSLCSVPSTTCTVLYSEHNVAQPHLQPVVAAVRVGLQRQARELHLDRVAQTDL